MHGWGWYGGLGWIGMITGMILLLLFFGGVILFVGWAVRRTNNNSANSSPNLSGGPGQLTAKEILKVRYAKGELTREEYQNMLADIER